MLGTSDAWWTSHLSQQSSEPAYHIIDFWIFFLLLLHYQTTQSKINQIFLQLPRYIYTYLTQAIIKYCSAIIYARGLDSCLDLSSETDYWDAKSMHLSFLRSILFCWCIGATLPDKTGKNQSKIFAIKYSSNNQILF